MIEKYITFFPANNIKLQYEAVVKVMVRLIAFITRF